MDLSIHTAAVFTSKVLALFEQIMTIDDFLLLKLLLKRIDGIGAIKIVEYLLNKKCVQKSKFKFI